jgi:hypothetical protein
MYSSRLNHSSGGEVEMVFVMHSDKLSIQKPERSTTVGCR